MTWCSNEYRVVVSVREPLQRSRHLLFTPEWEEGFQSRQFRIPKTCVHIQYLGRYSVHTFQFDNLNSSPRPGVFTPSLSLPFPPGCKRRCKKVLMALACSWLRNERLITCKGATRELLKGSASGLTILLSCKGNADSQKLYGARHDGLLFFYFYFF